MRRYDPSHALPVIERGRSVLLKSRYLRRSLMLTGRKLALTLAFTVLVALAFGAGCRGFFPKNSLSSIAIQPPSPQVQVGQSTGLQAWGTYQDNSKSQLTSGVVWTTSNNQTVSIDPNTGEITGEGSGGTATITARLPLTAQRWMLRRWRPGQSLRLRRPDRLRAMPAPLRPSAR